MSDLRPDGEGLAAFCGMYFEEEDPEGDDLLANGGTEEPEDQGDSACGFEF